MKVLDLFCGAGGAAMGLHRAWPHAEIIGVDIKPQPRYPFNFVQADAMTFPLDGYDFIWASPPCQAYIQRNKNLQTKHPRLIEPLRRRLLDNGTPFCIENVPGAPLSNPFLLCGENFDLNVLRHRIFECSFAVLVPPCVHRGTVASGDYAAVYARGGKGHRRGRGLRDAASAPGPKWTDAMGIGWMTEQELTQAIPPAYSEFIAKQVPLREEEENGE